MVLGVALMAVASGGASGGDEAGESGEGVGPGSNSGEGAAPSAPDDLSFLCGGDYGTEEIDLGAEARDRVREEVERFVLTVYGDPGADPAGYERSVEQLVVGECFWDSPASGYVNGMEEIARAGGKAGAPSGSYDSPTFARELSHFDIDYARQGEDLDSGAGFTKVVGTAVWISEESNGDPRAWQGSITVGKSATVSEDWKILSRQTMPPTVDPEYESYLPAGGL